MENISTFLSLIIRKTLFPILKIIPIVSLLFIGNLSAQSIIYVDSSKTSSGIGTSWSTAYKTLKEATIVANNNTSIKEIRIAKGTYFPTTNTNRDSTFLISRGDIRIYGGYPSGGGTRNYATNPTILSGDIGTFGTQTDNSYHVMVIAGLAASADSVVVDGISVQWGRASGSGSFAYNGNSIIRNTGGGIFAYNNANGNKTTIRNCTISANYASDAGAGMCNTGSATLIVNCLFSGNYANYGGAMINGSSPVNIINCTIAGNHDNNGGGGMRNSSSVPTITNTIMYGNNGGISNNSSTPVITYSLVQGLTATTNGNLNGNTTNPLFVTPVEAGTTNTGGDYKLQNGSPCVNVGSNVAIPSGVDTDINGNNRLHCTTDMGAHELQVITWFVKPTVSGNGSGSSWSNASDDLQLTIENACANDEIWVAAGTYKPMRPANNLNTINVNNRDNAFVIKADVKIYGGFPATGTPILADRNWATNITTLSGDIGTVGYAGDNAFHVIISVGDVGRAVLDGFKVIAGKADGDGTIKVNSINLYRLYGGGMQNAASSPTIINCTFSDNFSGYMSGGGGMCNFSSSPILTNCSFSGNQTLLDGGGMYNFSSSPILTNCSFKANRAEYNGGGMYNSYSSPVLVNCSFSGNQADIRGGGMCNLNSSAPELSNCIFSGNRAFPFGGGMYNLSSSPLLTNCIVWGNSNQWGDISEILGDATVIYSIVRGGYTGTGNLDSDPIFENAPSYTTAPFTNGDYRLQACSPAINAGSNAAIPSNITIDLDGNPRIYNSGIVDMGAYETQGLTGLPDAPTAITPQSFCGSATVANLDITNGTVIKWYAAATGGLALLSTASLSTRSYFASQTVGGCESRRTEVSVTINTIPAAPTATNPQNFCGSATVADLATSNGAGIKWYAASGSGTALATSTALVNGNTYYASQTVSGCESTRRTAVSVSVNPIPIAPTATTSQAFCGSGTVANLVATGTAIRWYATGSGGTALATSTALVNGNTYYASQTVSGCESITRTGVSVSLNVIIRYVKAGASGNGTSWADASGDLQLMINQACPNTQIWVAEGTFKPNRPAYNLNTIDVNNRDNSFMLKSDVAIFGGFPNTGNPSFAIRNSNLYPTILSGDIGVIGNNTDNTYHVVICNRHAGTAVLDGFTITKGNSMTLSVSDDYVWIGGSNMNRKYGAGMVIFVSNPGINNCIFTENSSPLYGGAMRLQSSNPIISKSLFIRNEAYSGGGISASSSSPTIYNTIFRGNSATLDGGGIGFLGGSPIIINTTISGNSASVGGGISTRNNSSPSIFNAIIYGNSSGIGSYGTAAAVVNYCIVQGGFAGTGNVDANPLFVNAASYNYRLQACSPAINAGSNAVIPSNITIDLDGNPRIYNSGIVDMGAYEAQGLTGLPAAPTATTPQSFCGSATVAYLDITNGMVIKWYAATTGGSALLSTASLSTRSYFASQTVGGCESRRTEVSVTINTIPAAPTATTSQAFCGSGTVANLVATGTAIKWYDAATGGSELLTTTSLSTRSYFASQTLNGCESPRTEVAVTVNTIPAVPTATNPQSFCGSATVANLATTNGTAIKWYAAATGGSELLTTTSLSTRSYFASQTLNGCESPKTEVSVTVNTIPAVPTATNPQSFCGSATVANLTFTNGTGIKWYNVATGGSELLTTTSLSTSSYFASQIENGCESPRTEVEVTVNTIPATPTATNPQNFCGSATVANLTITNGTGIKWYATSGGGTVLATSTDLVNGNTYYASQTVSGCESFTRRAVSVSVNPIPIAPTATTSQAFCGSGTVANLVATGTAIKWYATGSGGTALATSTALVNGNTYYASQTVSGCESIIRTGVSVSLNVIIRYVKQGGIGDESGTSWTNASGDLQLMIKQSCPNSEVWVAQGTYLSSASGFILKNDVKIFGGFSNIGSPIFNERDPNSYPSILSGDNIRRVFYNNFSPSSKLTNSSILDGFTITEGNSGNGAGMYNANASPTLRNLIFKNNNSTGKGGAMYNAASNPLIVHCKFFENTSTNSGSAVCNASISTPSILGCLFVGNTAIASGGAIFADNASSYELINGTLYNNTGGGLSHAGNTTHPTVKNSIIYGNGQQVLNISAATAAIEYSLIEGGYIGIGNLDANPLFINTASNYSLQPCSPAINAGNNTAIPLGISTDIAGNQRIYESTVDIGAYENKGFSLQNIANSSLTSTGDCQTSDGWRHFYHNDGTDNKIFVSIQPQGQNLGTINASTKLNTHYGDEAKILIDPYQVVPFHIPFNRSWIVNTSKTFSSPVSVRFYFSDRDSIDLHNTIPIDSLEELIVYKVSGNNIWDVNSTGYKRHLHGTIADTSTYIFGNYQNLQYAEFQVNEFSTGTLGFKNSILPLNLISFTASAIEDKTQLQWRTVNEVNVSRFEIERSSDGIQWENISSTSASNGIEQNYTAWDNAPLAGSNYYRLKMIDIDGTFKYSKIVEVTFGNIENSANFQIYPNPNNGSFLIKAYGIGAKILPIKIYDNLGRVIHQNDIKEGTNSVDLKNLISGIYYLSIEKATEKKIYKIVIE